MANILGFVALGVCGASLFCSLLALALPSWQSGEIRTTGLGRVKFHSGLFKFCIQDTCSDLLDVFGVSARLKSSVLGARAVVMIGFLALVGALVSFVLLLFVMKGRKMLGYIAGGAAIAGGFFLMVGMGVYVDKVKMTGADLGAGSAFDILGWLSAWAAAGVMLFVVFTGSAES